MSSVKSEFLEFLPPLFDCDTFSGSEKCLRMGNGDCGEKAKRIFEISRFIDDEGDAYGNDGIFVDVPKMIIITTEYFDTFLNENKLDIDKLSSLDDSGVLYSFQTAAFPNKLHTQLKRYIEMVKVPLAVRPSNVQQDTPTERSSGMYPFYLLPNNHADKDVCLDEIIFAIKNIYGAVFCKHARTFRDKHHIPLSNAKMAVIIQEAVGKKHNERFYPHISGIAKTTNFYALPPAKPSDGVVDIVLGLSKTIYHNNISWAYSPAFPQVNPPYASIKDLLDQTQRSFWALSLSKHRQESAFNIKGYCRQYQLDAAEEDCTLSLLASTYRPNDDRIVMGTNEKGPRILDFAYILKTSRIPVNKVIKQLLQFFATKFDSDIEFKFGVILSSRGLPARFSILNITPLPKSHTSFEVVDKNTSQNRILVHSETVLGHGCSTNIKDIVFINKEILDPALNRSLVQELKTLNQSLILQKRPYVLIGFGRWGTSDPSVGIPVKYEHISGASVIVEATYVTKPFLASHGTHLFHHLMCHRVIYFTIENTDNSFIRWDWLQNRKFIKQSEHVRHLRLTQALDIRVNGASRCGAILIPQNFLK